MRFKREFIKNMDKNIKQCCESCDIETSEFTRIDYKEKDLHPYLIAYKYFCNNCITNKSYRNYL